MICNNTIEFIYFVVYHQTLKINIKYDTFSTYVLFFFYSNENEQEKCFFKFLQKYKYYVWLKFRILHILYSYYNIGALFQIISNKLKAFYQY